MSSTNFVIVKLEEAYINEEEVNGSSIIINSSIENVSSINRQAEVIQVPKGIKLNKGDFIIAHHNIFRLRNDYKGNLCQSDYYLGDNTYFIPPTEIFLRRQGLLENWEAIDPYVFIKPINLDESKELLVGLKQEHKGREHKKGIIRYSNTYLKSKGFMGGDLVYFKKNSEYEFKIEGEILYRMKTSDILLKQK